MNPIDLYQVLCNKDKNYDGKVFAAVKTTGVFCKPSCPCKKPLFKNVVFYDSLETCIALGYRECKVCHPLASLFDDNEAKKYAFWLEKEFLPAKSFKKHPLKSIEELMDIKNSFQKKVHVSLGKYIRVKRVNFMLREKKDGEPLFTHYIHSPIGLMIAVHTKIGLCLLEFVDRKMLETELVEIQKKTNGSFLFADNQQTQNLEKQLVEYFNGYRKTFDVPLDLIGTDFQKRVWSLLVDIPYGEVFSYKEQAMKYGDLNSIRAIASANGKNKISILIPCHRVIGSNGELVGYGGGIERKKELLLHEKKISNSPNELFLN
jgi:AraC family transcriptional regulator of adaptative response/methylated-DNA-[protein]-cysteine methyltransferase